MHQFKKCQVVMLSTKEKTDIFKLNNTNKLLYKPKREFNFHDESYQHLYIISDEDKKEGDYIYSDLVKQGGISIVKNFYINGILYSDAQTIRNYKIIASTNKYLGLPRPSNSFIKKYCELNGNIKDILVEYEEMFSEIGDIIPVGIFLKIASDNTITIKKYEKRIYTKQEVISLCDKAWEDGYSTKNEILYMRTSSNWINENIK